MTNEQIAELINRRRHQMLVHSYIYYELDTNIIDDATWSKWAVELRELQEQYPDISRQVKYYEEFKDWDASTGAFLPYKLPNIVKTANRLLNGWSITMRQPEIKQKPKMKKLF